MDKWKVLETENIFRSGLVSLDRERCELPDGRIMPNYYVFHFPDWVNIVALTKNKEMVLIRQYRHATRDIHWEVPGGAVSRGEDPQVGALRELEEETGFRPGTLVKVGANCPNPALQNNVVHTYLALDCELTSEQKLDPFEEIEVQLVSMDEAVRWLHEGRFNHNIVVASMYQALTWIEKNKTI